MAGRAGRGDEGRQSEVRRDGERGQKRWGREGRKTNCIFDFLCPIFAASDPPLCVQRFCFCDCFLVRVIIDVIWNRGGTGRNLQFSLGELMPHTPLQNKSMASPPPASNPFLFVFVLLELIGKHICRGSVNHSGVQRNLRYKLGE